MDISSIRQDGFPAVQPAAVSPQDAAERRALLGASRVVFSVDQGSRRPVLRVVDRETKEVVLQLPAEYVLRLAEDLARKS
jgi:flagellar protein FlaG